MINWNTRLTNGRNKTRHVSFKDTILLFFTQCKIFCLPLLSSFFWFPFVSLLLLLLIRLQNLYPALRYTLLVFLNTQTAIILITIIEFSLWQVIRQLLATRFSDDGLIDRWLLRISASTHLPLAKSTPERETVLFVFAQKQTFRLVNYIKRG